MDWESIRPLITGSVGGLFSLWLMKRWSRFIPRGYGDKAAKDLLAAYRRSLVFARVLFFGAIGVGIYVFKSGLVPSNSWGHGLLIVGIIIFGPVTSVLLPVLTKGKDRIGEAIAAYAIAERIPVAAVGVIFLLGAVCFATGIWSLL